MSFTGADKMSVQRSLQLMSSTALTSTTLFFLMGLPALAADLPTGGQITAGSAQISQSGTTLTITQDTAKMAADWQTFSIGAGHSVNFVQPSAQAVALNRVLGSDVSVIQGALNANGHVFLVNPNGVLFSPDAQVNVGGLVASTLNIRTEDFLTGRYQFEGDSGAAITNQGEINAAEGGTIALIAAKIINQGSITAESGHVLAGAGRKVLLDLGGPVKLEVQEGALETLIEQGGAIRVHGGHIFLTAKAAGDLASSVINHTGITEAQTLQTGERGEIILLGDMSQGTLMVSGTLDASAPDGGDGGFIETSAAHVEIGHNLNVTAGAVHGDGGEWLIDPFDYVIDAAAATAISNTLSTGTDMTITTDNNTGPGAGGAGDGNITVSAAILKDDGGDATLTLSAAQGIIMEHTASITSTDGALHTIFQANNDDSGGGFIWFKASGGVGATVETNGGDIILSGGSNVLTGYAEGVAGVIGSGITLDAANLLSSGGDIVLRGLSATTATTVSSTDGVSSSNTDGIRLHGGNTIDSGTGSISLTGVARGNTGASNGIETNYVGYSKIISAATNSTAISLSGNATAGNSANGWGTFLWGTNTSGIVLAATGVGGGITIEGFGRNKAAGGGSHMEPNAYVLAASGPISITGTKGAVSTYEDVVINSTVGYVASLPGGFGFASPVTASTSNISIIADSLSANRVFGGGTFTSSAVQSSGVLTIAPRTSGKAMAIQTTNPGAGPLWINPTSMFGASGLFKIGFSKFVFGDSNTGNITLNNYVFNNDTELNSSGNITLVGVTIEDEDLLLNVTGGGTITDAGILTLGGLKIDADSSAVMLDEAGHSIGALVADVASLAVVSDGDMAIGTIAGMNGITATGVIDIATNSGDITISRNITTTSTASNAITINAGKSAAANTEAGGNIILSGSPSITVGAGGRAILYSGSAVDSTGLTALVGASNVRHYSDETVYNDTTPLGASGRFAVYRGVPAPDVPDEEEEAASPQQEAAIKTAQTLSTVIRPKSQGSIIVNSPADNGTGRQETFLIGGLDIVSVSSSDFDDSGAGSTSGVNFSQLSNQQNSRLGTLNVFVIDGGIRTAFNDDSNNNE